MIFLIDIIIFLSIIFFAVNKTIRSTIPNEFFKLFALIIGILGAKFLYPDFLRSLIINLFSGLFNISENKIDTNFIYMISFFVQFFIFYYICLIFNKQIKNRIHINFKSTSVIRKINVSLLAFFRAFLITTMFIYALSSFPFYAYESKNKLETSKTYNAFSKISDFIIN